MLHGLVVLVVVAMLVWIHNSYSGRGLFAALDFSHAGQRITDVCQALVVPLVVSDHFHNTLDQAAMVLTTAIRSTGTHRAFSARSRATDL